MDTWTFNWLFWLAGFFLVFELTAVVMHWRTLSQQVWNWFSLGGQRKRYWQVRRIVFVVFWVLVGVHFFTGVSALWSVVLPGIPAGIVIVLSTFVWQDAASASETKGDLMGWFKKVLGGLKSAGNWVLRRGPLWAALLVGLGTVVPGIAPILKALASVLAGISGGSVDQVTVEVFSQILSGLLLLVGSLRKFWAILVKPV